MRRYIKSVRKNSWLRVHVKAIFQQVSSPSCSEAGEGSEAVAGVSASPRAAVSSAMICATRSSALVSAGPCVPVPSKMSLRSTLMLHLLDVVTAIAIVSRYDALRGEKWVRVRRFAPCGARRDMRVRPAINARRGDMRYGSSRVAKRISEKMLKKSLHWLTNTVQYVSVSLH